MKRTQHRHPTVTIRSPALHLGSVAVSEPANQHPRLFSGTRLKAFIFPSLHWLIRHTPVWLALLPVRLVIVFARLFYWWPANRLRIACVSVSRLTDGLTPGKIYTDFLGNALGVIENFFCLYRQGGSATLPRISMKPGDIAMINQLIKRHGGLILAVPHNIGSAFSALRIGHTFDMLLVAKNSPTIERTRIALDFYERMPVSVLMVRGGNPFELSRVMFSVLKQGKLVAATLDNLDRTSNSVPVRMFGQEVGLAGWAAKIAIRMQVPILPAWFHSSGRQLQVITGNPFVGEDVQAAVQHYAHFFEQQILNDPASWAYLADKRWQRILEKVR
jgi:hypothetical protein